MERGKPGRIFSLFPAEQNQLRPCFPAGWIRCFSNPIRSGRVKQRQRRWVSSKWSGLGLGFRMFFKIPNKYK